MPWLATIGYEGAALDDFLATLREAGVTILIDIRQVPASRRAGSPRSGCTRRSMALASATYIWWALVILRKGAMPHGRAGLRSSGRSSPATCEPLEAQTDLQIAADLAQDGGACLLCYERQPEFCHRSIVADALAETTGVDVRHLGVRGGLAKHDGDERSRPRAGAGQGIATCR